MSVYRELIRAPIEELFRVSLTATTATRRHSTMAESKDSKAPSEANSDSHGEVLDTPLAKTRRRRNKYPWDVWFDGQPRRIYRDEHYPGTTTKAMHSSMYPKWSKMAKPDMVNILIAERVLVDGREAIEFQAVSVKAGTKAAKEAVEYREACKAHYAD